jgi:hypothetical protein
VLHGSYLNFVAICVSKRVLFPVVQTWSMCKGGVVVDGKDGAVDGGNQRGVCVDVGNREGDRVGVSR